MRRGVTMAVVLAALLLAGCDTGDKSPQAAPTTTSTTAPDPATTACRQHNADVEHRPKEGDAALEQLTVSRDPRIAAAAVKVDGIIRDRALDPDAVPAGLDMEYAEAELEPARACKAAGFLP